MKVNDLEYMVYGLNLTYDEVIVGLDKNFTAATTIGYTLPPGVYEICDLNRTLKDIIPSDVEVDNIIDD